MTALAQVEQVLRDLARRCALPIPAEGAAGATLAELGLESLHFVELALALEETFPGIDPVALPIDGDATAATLAAAVAAARETAP